MARLDLRDPEGDLVVLEEAEVGAEVEELVLDRGQGLGQARHESAGEGDADRRVQFVDGAVGRDTSVSFGPAGRRPGRSSRRLPCGCRCASTVASVHCRLGVRTPTSVHFARRASYGDPEGRWPTAKAGDDCRPPRAHTLGLAAPRQRVCVCRRVAFGPRRRRTVCCCASRTSIGSVHDRTSSRQSATISHGWASPGMRRHRGSRRATTRRRWRGWPTASIDASARARCAPRRCRPVRAARGDATGGGTQRVRCASVSHQGLSRTSTVAGVPVRRTRASSATPSLSVATGWSPTTSRSWPTTSTMAWTTSCVGATCSNTRPCSCSCGTPLARRHRGGCTRRWCWAQMAGSCPSHTARRTSVPCETQVRHQPMSGGCAAVAGHRGSGIARGRGDAMEARRGSPRPDYRMTPSSSHDSRVRSARQCHVTPKQP